MSQIPPTWLGSIIQTQGAEKRAAEKKARSDADETESVRGGNFAENLQNVIENSDRDGEVYSDAEGQGNQGKPFDETEDEDQQTPVSDQEEPGTGLDVEA